MIFNLITKAKDLFYNNKTSGLSATNVQDAIDEINNSLVKKSNQIKTVTFTGTMLSSSQSGNGNTHTITIPTGYYIGGVTFVSPDHILTPHVEKIEGNKITVGWFNARTTGSDRTADYTGTVILLPN